MYKKLEQTKHFFRMIGYIFSTIYKVGKDKRTWAVVAFIVWSYLIGWFNSNYYMRSPVAKWQSVVVERYPKYERSVTIKAVEKQKPTPTPKLINQAFEEAFDTVWFNESNRGNDKTGLNGTCIKKGLLNEIGYAPHDNWCFVSREEQKKTFMLWLQNRLDHKKMPYCDTIKECILYYTNSAYTI